MTTGYDLLSADWLTMTGWHNDWLGLLASITGYPLLAIGNDLPSVYDRLCQVLIV